MRDIEPEVLVLPAVVVAHHRSLCSSFVGLFVSIVVLNIDHIILYHGFNVFFCFFALALSIQHLRSQTEEHSEGIA